MPVPLFSAYLGLCPECFTAGIVWAAKQARAAALAQTFHDENFDGA